MKENNLKPLLLLDIDGVCLPMNECLSPSQFLIADYGVEIKVDEEVVQRVKSLFEIFEVVWTTAWEAESVKFTEQLGLPTDKPWIEFSSFNDIEDVPNIPVETWKLPSVIEYNKDYKGPLAWLDDDLSYDAEDWASFREGPTLLVKTDPGPGISEEDFLRLKEFSEQHSS